MSSNSKNKPVKQQTLDVQLSTLPEDIIIIMITTINIIIIIGTTTFCGSWPALKTFSSHHILVPLFSS
jgi:hypothetical protein